MRVNISLKDKRGNDLFYSNVPILKYLVKTPLVSTDKYLGSW